MSEQLAANPAGRGRSVPRTGAPTRRRDRFIAMAKAAGSRWRAAFRHPAEPLDRETLLLLMVNQDRARMIRDQAAADAVRLGGWPGR